MKSCLVSTADPKLEMVEERGIAIVYSGGEVENGDLVRVNDRVYLLVE